VCKRLGQFNTATHQAADHLKLMLYSYALNTTP
jgi:hypothetical protein